MKPRLIPLFVVVFMAITAVGCIAQGHRKLTIGFLGTQIVIEDEAYKNDEGRETYRVGFDEDSSVVEWFFGWLKPPPSTPETSGSGE